MSYFVAGSKVRDILYVVLCFLHPATKYCTVLVEAGQPLLSLETRVARVCMLRDFNSPMISIPAFNAWITSGDFVRARNAAYNDQLVVCQVNEVHPPSTLSVTFWLEDGLLDAEHKRHRIPLIQADLLNLFKCSIKEVTS